MGDELNKKPLSGTAAEPKGAVLKGRRGMESNHRTPKYNLGLYRLSYPG